MARKIDPAVASILKGHGFGPEACWDCHGVWVVYHRVLEQIAAQANIRFDMPQVLEANGAAKSVALCVAGHLGEKCEWSVGEAAPGNNKNSYPYAMAEKRAKDRVILKLIGLHGLVYSEEEMPEGEKPPTPASAKPDPLERSAAFVETSGNIIREMKAKATAPALKAWGNDPRNKARIAALTDDGQALVREAYMAHMDEVSNLLPAG